jgi:hypothetical protein
MPKVPKLGVFYQFYNGNRWNVTLFGLNYESSDISQIRPWRNKNLIAYIEK